MTEYMRVSNNVLIKKPATAGVQQQERSENLIMLEGLGETFTMQATYQAKGLEPPAVAEPSLMVSCLIRVPSLKNYSEKFKMICLPSETRSEIELLLAKWLCNQFVHKFCCRMHIVLDFTPHPHLLPGADRFHLWRSCVMGAWDVEKPEREP